jgi:hypothetical protein
MAGQARPPLNHEKGALDGLVRTTADFVSEQRPIKNKLLIGADMRC